MTSPTINNFRRVAKLLNRTTKSVSSKYNYLLNSGKLSKKEENNYINIDKNGNAKVESNKKFKFFGGM